MPSQHVYPDEPLLRPPSPHKCRRFEGKVVVMTAATKGLAYATAIRFAEEGEWVMLTSSTHHSLARSCLMHTYICMHRALTHPSTLSPTPLTTLSRMQGAKLVISSRKQDAVDEAVAPLVARGFDVSGIACHQVRCTACPCSMATHPYFARQLGLGRLQIHSRLDCSARTQCHG